MFIGREAELKFLQDKFDNENGQLVVLYGRRRVGKTETLREFCKGKQHVFYSCTQSTDKVQLSKFSKHILKEDIPAKQYISEFADWESAFRSVLDFPFGDQKKLLIIDEFPYMCKGNKSIPSVLQNLWDAELKDKNIMIIGDSISTESTNPPNWVTRFKTKLNGVAGTITNNSQGGYKMVDLNTDINSLITNTSNDIILIFLGVNDWYSNIPLSPFQFSSVDNNSFEGCLIQIVMKLFDRYTQLGATRYPEVYFITPLHELWQTPMNTLGYTLDLYRKAIIGLCKIAGCGWINGDGAVNLSNTISSARKTMYLPDGTHPTNKYSEYLCDYIIDRLVKGGDNSEIGSDGQVIDWSSKFSSDVTNGVFKMWACGSGLLKYEISGTVANVTGSQTILGNFPLTLFAPYTNMFRYLPAAYYNTTLGGNGGATLFITSDKLYLGLNPAPVSASAIQFMANGVVHSRCLEADDQDLF